MPTNSPCCAPGTPACRFAKPRSTMCRIESRQGSRHAGPARRASAASHSSHISGRIRARDDATEWSGTRKISAGEHADTCGVGLLGVRRKTPALFTQAFPRPRYRAPMNDFSSASASGAGSARLSSSIGRAGDIGVGETSVQMAQKGKPVSPTRQAFAKPLRSAVVGLRDCYVVSCVSQFDMMLRSIFLCNPYYCADCSEEASGVARWLALRFIEPPSWIIGDEVIANGGKGILLRSRLSPDGINLVLWYPLVKSATGSIVNR
jgi:hypothetical protein